VPGPNASTAVLASCSLSILIAASPALAQPEPGPEPPPADAGAPPPVEPPPGPEARPTVPAPAKPEPVAPLPEKPAPAAAPAEPKSPPPSGFAFGSYGRMVAATDGQGRPGRDADIVAHGSRLDEANYAELELRRDDFWTKTDSTTRLVATLAIANPVFHYDGDFDIHMAVRNLFLEERDLGAKGLSAWVGSRMYRGDDIYLLDWWPLDNLNTLGGGVRYDFGPERRTSAAVHMGLNQPDSLFFHQSSPRPSALNQFGATDVAVLDRQKWIGSLKLQHIVPFGKEAGLKGVGWVEMHRLPAGQRETDPAVFEDVPADDGYVIGGEVGAFSGKRDTHVNLFVRYARGLAAYGDLVTPYQLALDRTTSGAHEISVALGGNWELGMVGVMVGAYFRSFRDASNDLDAGDIDEGIFAVRPHVFFGEWGGLAVEGSFQAQQRGVVRASDGGVSQGPLSAHLFRFGLVPFISPAGRGDYSRPHIRFIWAITARDDAARALYPRDDVFGLRKTEHFIGLGAEWWFNSSSYGG